MAERTPKANERHRTLPQFLPDHGEEKVEGLVVIMKERVNAYFAQEHSQERKEIDTETQQVNIETQDTYAATAVSSRKKTLSTTPSYYQAIDALKYKTRLNEDVARAGKRWYVIADGLTNYERNVCALMGESFSLAFDWMIQRIEAMEPKPQLSTVIAAFQAVPPLARSILEKASAHHPDRLTKYTHTDLSTTVEAVYYAPWLKQAVVVHIGDSRSYAVRANGSVEQLTEDHVSEAADQSRFFISSSLNTAQDSAPRIDIFSFALNPGDKIVSLCDGAFAYQAIAQKLDRTPPIEHTLQEMPATNPDDLLPYARELVDNGRFYQDSLSRWDDTSAGALLVTQ